MSAALWSLEELLAATGGRVQGSPGAITGISIDTRTSASGDLFVALKDVRDGHDFVADALAKGAAAALVARVPDGVPSDAPLIVVHNVQTALEALGRAGRARMAGQVIAVTGSAGKTTTKEMLLAALSDQGRTHASVASYNNHWGVPLTLARMPVETEFAVIEIGMNAPGEIAPLSRMAAPHIAIVTTVAAAHLAAFEDLAGIAREKASIFEGLASDGAAIFNVDLETSDILLEKAAEDAARSIGFGKGDTAQAQLIDCTFSDQATIARVRIGAQNLALKLSLPGRHLAMNATASLAAIDAVGGDLARALMSLGAWRPLAGRGQRLRIEINQTDGEGIELIDDAYNANPASVAAGLEVLAAALPQGRGRRIAVLGDMLELGAGAADLHAGLANLPQMVELDLVHTTGPLMAHLHAALPAGRAGLHMDTSEDLARALPPLLRAGDVILVKGSLGSKMGRVVDGLKKLGHSAPNRVEGA
ncbi:MAG: UDP-N-acetylmuramoyl-tripeptide--D-alanyl-D-alanine ligase [Pseudomonadota bacterium]